jgi:hypothetical protein
MAISNIRWDEKARPDLDELREALQWFGVQVYEDPEADSDSVGFIFSASALSPKGVAQAAAALSPSEPAADPDLTANHLAAHFLLDPSEYREAPEAALKEIDKYESGYHSALIGKHPKKGYFVVVRHVLHDNDEELAWAEWDID